MTTRPNNGSLANQASFVLSQLGYHAAEGFAERLAGFGLRPRHYGMLIHLAATEGLTQQQLADSMRIHRNVMVGLVDELEQSGLVERRRHPDDRRAYALHLTERAHDVLPAARQVAEEHNEQLLAPLNRQQRRELLTMLRLLADGAGLGPEVHPGLHA